MKKDWVEQLGDRVEAHVQRTKGAGAQIVCASGISPSGPVHLGNLREVMTVHLVADELHKRGLQVEHVHFWDDYDRLRKIPAGVPAEYKAYIGCPIADIPDPAGEFASYAERYITDFTRGLEQLGIYPHFVRQSLAYRSGAYTSQIKLAMARRFEIFDTLSEFQTLQAQQETLTERRNSYYPYRVYCEQCNRDTTSITHYNETDAMITYTCQACRHAGSFCLDEKIAGKLIWKVDWPMRWSVAQVDFEPAGADHSAPGSSFTVGQKLVQSIYNAPAPQYVGYAFVGMDGRSKISSSTGTTATLSSALDITEPCILRWLYARRSYNQGFNIDYGQGLLRLYDEWDGLVRQIREGKANEVNQKIYARSTHTTHGQIAQTPQNVPFSLLTSVLDVTQGNVEQTLRIVGQHLRKEQDLEVTSEQLEPRLTCALKWVTLYLPEDERTSIRSTFDAEAYEQIGEKDREALQMLVESLDDAWDLTGLTSLMYNLPRLVRGIPLDTPIDAEMKQAQRSFFVAIYTLICGKDTGPRIPTLLLSLGKEKVKALLTSQKVVSQQRSTREEQ